MGSVEEPQSVMTDRNTRAKRLPARALADTATRRPRSLPALTRASGSQRRASPCGDSPVRSALGVLGRDLPAQGREIDGRETQLGAAGARKLEEVVDQLAHRLGRLAHSTEVIAAFLPEDIALLLDKDLAESVDRAKRCPQIVRDRVRERAELLVRRVHLGNAVLELPIQRPDLGEEIVAAQDERDLPGEEVHDLEIVLGEERRPRRVDREHAVPRSTP